MRSALIHASIVTETGLLKKKPCDPRQAYSVMIFDTDKGIYNLDYHFTSLDNAEEFARSEYNAKWIFTHFEDAEKWLNAETGR